MPRLLRYKVKTNPDAGESGNGEIHNGFAVTSQTAKVMTTVPGKALNDRVQYYMHFQVSMKVLETYLAWMGQGNC